MTATKKRASGGTKKGPEKTRTLSAAELRDLARQYTAEALNTLREIMCDPGADPEARATAAEELRLRRHQLGIAEEKSAGSP